VTTREVLVIGAGPFGLSISAHLRGLGVDHMIVGRPAGTWRSRMPVGMCLKSEPHASVISSPGKGYDIATYCASKGFDYVDRVGPLTLERFLGYADWFTENLVPDVHDEVVTEVAKTDDGFRVAFAEAAPVSARRVVVATGVLPYARVPTEFSGLPKDLVTHTSEHHLLDKFAGRRVAVIGGGQSATESAALLHEQGADVVLIARVPELSWGDPNPEHVTLLGRLRRPVTRLCEGWRCAAWNTPAFFRLLPQDLRVTKARTVLGPSGSWWLRDRVEGAVEVLTSHHVTAAVPHGSGVRLTIDGREPATLDVDHVMCGTGFPIDISRLPFLPAKLRARITTVKGYPVLSRTAQSAVPGLYFAGAPASASIGPSMRFIAGTHNVASLLAAEVSRTRDRRSPAA
jgi:lysine/ornithine N-monooxygenase